MEKILITGGTGFIGRNLIPLLQENNYNITIKTRTPDKFQDDFFFRNVNFIWELEEAPTVDIVLNLCGENLADKRWSRNQKITIYNSRIQNTIELVDWMIKQEQKPHTFISGSAIGYYGARGDETLNEMSKHGDLKQFQSKLCHNWELSAKRAAQEGIRTAIIRTGIVLGQEGALAKMLKPFKLGLGGKIGSGKQWMSWIHIQDQIQAIMHLISNSQQFGVFNLTAPNPVTNLSFTQTLAKIVNKPAKVAVPAFVLKAALGEFSELLLTGQKVLPEALQKSGFEFQFPELELALADLLKD
ncbi:TIGR01777 family oxidoreductase [Kangiella sp. TOML190]|uniref:TIGR01777 family oxidoreductase n=1 Tax=Kangiella sp. TOML190 TaxID=2931351 RepID=UPI00203A9366|nr:TIGR01777 family oxidoreductase [Kangiella sp. TOML190]